MLPIPIFLLLLFSAAILAPSPHSIISFIRTATLQSSAWSTLPATVSSSVPRSPLETIPELPIPIPQVFLDTSPTTCGPSPTHEALSNTTIPYSPIHATDDHPLNTAVLLVVLLVMFNYLVHKLLVDDPNPSRAEGMSEQLVVFPSSAPATSLSQKSICHRVPVVDETPSPFLSVDSFKSLEHESATLALMIRPPPSFEVTILSQPSTPLRQSLHVLSRDFSLDNSEKTTGDDWSPTTSSPSDSTLFDYPSVSVTSSPDFKAPSTVSVASLIEIGHLVLEPPDNTPLVSEATEEDNPTRLDPSNVAHVPEPETGSTLHDNPMSPPAIEDAPDFSADGEGVSSHQQPESESESDDEETFDYRGVDWTPEVPGTTPAPTAKSQAPLPDLHPLLGSHFFEPALSPSANPAARACAARYALDDIQVGIKGRREDKTTSITRCTSISDFGGTLEATKTTHALPIPDGRTAMMPRRDSLGSDILHHRVILRADAPIFKPRYSGKDEEDRQLRSGLKASIHAPRNEETLQMEGRVGVSQSTGAIGQECAPVATPATTPGSPESSIDNCEFQTLDAVEEPKSSENAQLTRSISPVVSSGIHASIHAPRSKVDQALDENTERLTTQPSLSTTRSTLTDNRMQIGLAGSIHAPGARCSIPHQAGPGSSKHSADAPNWAAIARAEVSSEASRGSAPAQSGNSSNLALDNDGSELPTTTRCAAKDREEEEEGSIDNSDGPSDHADDLEDGTGSGETDDGLDEADDELNEQEQDSTTRCRRNRRRGKPRRRRRSVPYVPPPRMQNLTQHPIVNLLAAQAQAPPNALVSPPAALSGQYYTHSHSPSPHHPASAPGHMVPPNAMPNHLGRHPRYPYSPHLGSPQTATHYPSHAPGFQPPGPHNPTFYSHIPHAQNFSSQAPFIPLYGR